MNGTYFLHRSLAHPCRALGDTPRGRVTLLGEPIVGESMLIVPERGGVLQTSPVRHVTRIDDGFLVETANSVYRFTSFRDADHAAA